MRVNDAMVERLENVIETLRENSIKMGQMLAVHDEKLTKQDRIMEKKMWSIFGGLAIISFVVSPIGMKVVGSALTPDSQATIIELTQ